jgi:hypothetical protein
MGREAARDEEIPNTRGRASLFYIEIHGLGQTRWDKVVIMNNAQSQPEAAYKR